MAKKDTKGKNITVLVTEDLRNRIDVLRQTYFAQMQNNQFTAYLVEIGLREEETRFKEQEARIRARIKAAETSKKEAPETNNNKEKVS